MVNLDATIYLQKIMKIVSRHYRKANFVVVGLQCRIIVVYHVEIPRPFINLPYHIWSCYGSFKGKLQQFSVLCNFPVKKPIKLPFMVRGAIVHNQCTAFGMLQPVIRAPFTLETKRYCFPFVADTQVLWTTLGI